MRVHPAEANHELIHRLQADGMTSLMISTLANKLLDDDYENMFSLVGKTPYAFEPYDEALPLPPPPFPSRPPPSRPPTRSPPPPLPTTPRPCSPTPRAQRARRA